MFYYFSSQLHVFQLCSDTFIGEKASESHRETLLRGIRYKGSITFIVIVRQEKRVFSKFHDYYRVSHLIGAYVRVRALQSLTICFVLSLSFPQTWRANLCFNFLLEVDLFLAKVHPRPTLGRFVVYVDSQNVEDFTPYPPRFP